MVFLMAALCLFGCEKTDGKVTEPLDPEQLTEAFSIFDGGMTFRLDIEEDRFSFYEDGVYDSVYQTFQHSGIEDVEISKNGVMFEDVNFDGFTDVIIPQRKLGELQYYYGYLWDEEKKVFIMNLEFLNIGNPVINENSVSGTVSEHGSEHEAEFFYEDGHFVSEHEHEDPYLEVAEAYMKGFLGRDDVECLFTSWELIDSSICKKYYVTENGEPFAACAVNADGSRVFYTLLTESYTEIIFAEDAYSESAESYGKMEHTNENFTYVAEGYESLSDDEKDRYGALYSDLTAFKELETVAAEDVSALYAVFSDHPDLYNYYRVEEKHGIISAKLFCKWAPYKTPEASELTEAVTEYDAFIDGIVSSMPVGLEPLEKYLFLAQRLELMSKGHEGDEVTFELLISADSQGEKIARTYMLICEKAQLYCTYEGNVNTVLVNGEKVNVSVEKSFNHVPGSEKWFSAFYME